MARAFLRETMIALRARRQAYRIATDFLYDEPIDVETFPCHSCGRQIRPVAMTEHGWVRCSVCGVSNRAPAHLRSRVSTRVAVPGERIDSWRDATDDHEHRRRMWIILIVAYTLMFCTWLIAYFRLS